MRTTPQFSIDLLTFTKKIFNEKLLFLRNVKRTDFKNFEGTPVIICSANIYLLKVSNRNIVKKVENMFKVDNVDTTTMSMTSF